MEEALKLFPDTKEDDWLKVGRALIHKDIDLTNFKGKMQSGIFRNGTFHHGEFFGGIYHTGIYHGGCFRGGVWKRSPLFIQGTRDFICESDNNHICCGCIRVPLEWWTESHLDYIGKQNNYTLEQVEEYKGLIYFVKSEMERLNGT